MDFQELIATLFQAFMTAAIPVISAFLIRFINSQNKEVQGSIKNEMAKKYLTEVADAVSKAVLYVSQTYVDALKESDKWTAETKKIAFDRAMAAAWKQLTTEAKNFLEMAYSDINDYLKTQIEAEIKTQKKEVKFIWPNSEFSRDTAV